MEGFDGLSVSESSTDTDTSNVVSEESSVQEGMICVWIRWHVSLTPYLIFAEPVTYDLYPSEPIDEVKTAWTSIMQALDEAKMPREYQRRLVSVFNSQVLSHIREGKSDKCN